MGLSRCWSVLFLGKRMRCFSQVTSMVVPGDRGLSSPGRDSWESTIRSLFAENAVRIFYLVFYIHQDNNNIETRGSSSSLPANIFFLAGDLLFPKRKKHPKNRSRNRWISPTAEHTTSAPGYSTSSSFWRARPFSSRSVRSCCSVELISTRHENFL